MTLPCCAYYTYTLLIRFATSYPSSYSISLRIKIHICIVFILFHCHVCLHELSILAVIRLEKF